MMELGRVYESGEKNLEAYDTYAKIVAICKEHGIPRDPIVATALGNIGRLDNANGDLDNAQKHLAKAIGIYTTTGDFYPVLELGYTQGQLADVGDEISTSRSP
jgi:tetratricopeptide (TPR) repeat protein